MFVFTHDIKIYRSLEAKWSTLEAPKENTESLKETVGSITGSVPHS